MMDWLPRPALAAAFALAAWIGASTARWFLGRAGRTERIARIISKSGVLSGLREPSLDQYRRAIGAAVYWGFLCAGLAGAISLASDTAASRLEAWISRYVPEIVTTISVLLGTRWTARYWSRCVLIAAVNAEVPHPSRWAGAARLGTLFAGVALTSELTGVARELIRPAFLIVLGATGGCLALALSPLIRESLARRRDERDREPDEACR